MVQSKPEAACSHLEGIASFTWNGVPSRGLHSREDPPPGDPRLLARQAAPPQKNCCLGQVYARSRFAGNFLARVPACRGEREGVDRRSTGSADPLRQPWRRIEGLWLLEGIGLNSARTSFPGIGRPTGLEGFFFFLFWGLCVYRRGGEYVMILPFFFFNGSLTFSPPAEQARCARLGIAPTLDSSRCLKGVGGILK